jgi:antitoxin component YwqK of YwqJK toxin-antitoxin module
MLTIFRSPEEYIENGSGDLCTFSSRKLHSYNDQPAIIKANGTRIWYKYGKKHRKTLNENGLVLPALISEGGDMHWYRNGKLHRDNDLPAFEHLGYKAWYRDGKPFRENDKPNVVRGDGTQEWRNSDDKLHRDTVVDGQVLHATISKDGIMQWYKDSKRHSYNDQPAVVYPTGERA